MCECCTTEEKGLTGSKYFYSLACYVCLEDAFWQSGAQILQKESREISVHITGCNLAEDEPPAPYLPWRRNGKAAVCREDVSATTAPDPQVYLGG